jgi:hypothetical protein
MQGLQRRHRSQLFGAGLLGRLRRRPGLSRFGAGLLGHLHPRLPPACPPAPLWPLVPCQHHVDLVSEEVRTQDPRELPDQVPDLLGAGSTDGHHLSRQELQQTVGGVQCQGPALVEEDYPVAALRFVQVGGRHQDRHPLRHHLVENEPEVPPGNGIHSEGGLVQQEDPGMVDEGAGEGELLLHSPGEVARKPVLEGAQIGEGVQALQAPRPFRPGNPVEVRVELDVLPDGEVGVEAELLGHVGNEGLHPLRVLAHLHPLDHRRAGRGR